MRRPRKLEATAPSIEQTVYSGRSLIGSISNNEAGAFLAVDADGTLIGEYRSCSEAALSLDASRAKGARRA
jgi:hypothetical protein